MIDTPRTPRSRASYTLHDHEPQPSCFATAMLEGLATPQKAVPFPFLYDAEGSALFERICEQPEYYPTRTEIGILETHASAMAALAGPCAQLVELGSGAGIKVKLLLDAMVAPAAYIPVEISRSALTQAAEQLAKERPGLNIHAVCADYHDKFELPLNQQGPVVGFFPGSSIGNFEREPARDFLAQWAQRLGPDSHMLIGVDLLKPIDLLERAYNDAAGVTAAFTLNLLERANRELNANFKIENFCHHARYNPASGAVETHLVSLADQDVRVAGHEFRFLQGERLHVENSHKYTLDDFAELAHAAGFDWLQAWTDPQQWFSVHYLRTARS